MGARSFFVASNLPRLADRRAIGLIALVLGALFNAHLNRARDDRLRKIEQRTLAAALKAELFGLAEQIRSITSLVEGVQSLEKHIEAYELAITLWASDPVLLPHMLPK